MGGGQRVDEDEVSREVQRCLEMVAISRVFDLEGLWEVLGEVSQQPQTGRETDPLEPESEDAEPVDEEAVTESSNGEDHELDEGTEILIIDNMGHVINELFSRKERGEGRWFEVTSLRSS